MQKRSQKNIVQIGQKPLIIHTKYYKFDALFKLIDQQSDVDKVFLYAKDAYEEK